MGDRLMLGSGSNNASWPRGCPKGLRHRSHQDLAVSEGQPQLAKIRFGEMRETPSCRCRWQRRHRNIAQGRALATTYVRRCSLASRRFFTPLCVLAMWSSRRRGRECRRNAEVHPSRFIVPTARDLRRTGKATIACLAGAECDAVYGDARLDQPAHRRRAGLGLAGQNPVTPCRHTRSPARFRLLQRHNVWSVR